MTIIIPYIDDRNWSYHKTSDERPCSVRFMSSKGAVTKNVTALVVKTRKDKVVFQPQNPYEDLRVELEFPQDPARLRRLSEGLSELADELEGEQAAASEDAES